MTETPETDAAEWGITPNDMVVRSGLARKLERERDTAIAERDAMRVELDAMRAEANKYIQLWHQASKELETIKFGSVNNSRDALVTALQQCRDDSIGLLWENGPRYSYSRYEKIKNNIARANAALAAVKAEELGYEKL